MMGCCDWLSYNTCTSWRHYKMTIFSVMAWRIKCVTLMMIIFVVFRNLMIQKYCIDHAQSSGYARWSVPEGTLDQASGLECSESRFKKNSEDIFATSGSLLELLSEKHTSQANNFAKTPLTLLKNLSAN